MFGPSLGWTHKFIFKSRLREGEVTKSGYLACFAFICFWITDFFKKGTERNATNWDREGWTTSPFLLYIPKTSVTSRVSWWVHPSIVVPVPEHFISGSHCTIPGLESYRLLWSGGWDFLSNIPARTERAKPHRVTRSQRGDKTGKCGSTPRSWAWGTVARGRAVQARLWPEWRHLNTCLILGPSMPQSVVSTAVMNSQASLRKPTSSPLKTLRFNKCGYSIGGLGCQGQKLLKRKEREENQKVV